MKFSDLDRSKWEELKPFLDTCLLPVTGMSGREAPWEATEALERLRDVLDVLEKRYLGRMVTYPAFHYTEGPGSAGTLANLCMNLKNAGFRYVIIASQDKLEGEVPEADLILTSEDAVSGAALRMVDRLWNGKAVEAGG